MSEQQPVPQCVVILGGGSGIGAATARRLAGEGAAIVLLDRDEDAARRVAGEIGGRSLFIGLDALDEAAMQAAARRVEESGLPPVDGLVASAGIAQPPTPVEDFDADAFDRVLDSHVRTSYTAARAFGGGMAARGRGAVVLLASVLAFRPGPVFAYGAGKAALVSLTQSLAVHWAAKGVRVNAVAPGWTDTPLLQRPNRDGSARDFSPILESTPQGRLLRPDEIAAVIRFLLSSESSAVTGATLPADGGVIAGSGWAPYGGFPRA